MGFYRPDQPKSKTVSWKKQGWRGIGVVVLSALVGSGATLALMPVILPSMYPQVAAQASLASGGSNSGFNVPQSTVNVNISDGITQVVKKVEPDVVAVVNYTTSRNFFTNQPQTQEADLGSGVYFYHSGNNAYIVTNNHVVQGGTKVEIVLQSGKRVAGKVVGTDPFTDLAVIKIPASNFSFTAPIQFANSNDLQVGEPAIAIGNPMGLNFADSVTAGIVSGDQRMMPVENPSSQQTLDDQPVIQTDAAINPGNSGGPLLNIQGQMIGINCSKIVATGFNGMGFAIPSNEVKNIAAQLVKNGYAIHPSIGIAAIDVSSIMPGYGPNVPVNYGVIVESVLSQAAKKAGLRSGDVIVGLNGKTITGVASLRTALFNMKIGQTVQLTIYRGNRRMNVSTQITAEKSPNTTSPSYTNSSGSSNSANLPSPGIPFVNPFAPFGG